MNMPAHLTTFRGRGGFGASTQKLMDVFFQMVTSATTPQALQTLMHFYIAIHGTVKTDAEMNVAIGYPLSTFSSQASKKSGNTGNLALNTGAKIYIAADAVPIAKYFAWFVPRMIPFYSSAGGNQIDVVVNSKRAVKCWMWGSSNGQGFCR